MAEESGRPETEPDDTAKSAAAKKLEAVGWGTALLWIGVCALLGFDWPFILIGLGIIALVMQSLRRSAGLKLEPFWLVLGVVFIVAGAWEMISRASFPLIPVALILAGLGLVGSAVLRQRSGGG